MAAIALQIADSLTQDEIPIKLRCASCNKLVVNAFRLPCCDQNVCESCQTTLPESCPVCMHSPLSADDCKPNKSLRLTVKAFLKNEEKKRDKLRAEAAPPPIAAVAEPTPPAEISTFVEPAPVIADEASTKADDVMQSIETEDLAPVEPVSKEIDSADSSLLETCDPRADNDDKDHARDSASIEIITGDGDGDGQDRTDQSAAAREASKFNEHKGMDQQQNINGGLEASAVNNGFGGFNPMMMQQNGMNGMGMNNMNMNGMNGMGGWGGFQNMMGMNMDPSMMMFGNGFNGQSMGFNGMNMNMGMMGGYDGGYGNWGGQGGMNGGDYGPNAGYYPNSGYNQPSHRGARFNSMSQRQPSHMMNNSRPGQGQGYSHKAHESAWEAQDQQRGAGMLQNGQAHAEKHQQDGQSEQRVVPEARAADTNGPVPVTNGDNQGNDMLRDSEMPAEQNVDQVNVTEQSDARPATTNEQAMHSTMIGASPGIGSQFDQQQSIDGFQPADQTMQMNMHQSYAPDMSMTPSGQHANFMPPQGGYNDFNARGRGAFRARGRGRGGFGRGGYGMESAAISLTHVEPIGTGVVGAPTGPKSMRAGAPVPGFRGRGGFVARGGRGDTFVAAQSPVNGHVRSMTSAEPGRPQSAAGVVDTEMRSRSGTKSPSSRRRRREESSTGDRGKRNGNESEDEFGRSTKRRKQSEDNAVVEKDVRDADAVVDADVGNVDVPILQDAQTIAEESGPALRVEIQSANEEELAPPEDKRLALDNHHDLRDGHESERSKDSQHHSRRNRSSRHDRDRSRDRERSHERSDRDSRRRRHHSRSRSPRRDNDDEKSRHRSRRHRSRSRSPRREAKAEKHDDTKTSRRSHRDHDRERDRSHRDRDGKKDEKYRERDHDRDRDHKSSRHEHDRKRETEWPQSSRGLKNDVQQPSVAAKASQQPEPNRMPPPAPPPSAPTGPRGRRPAPLSSNTTPAAPTPSSAGPKGPSGAVREFKIQGRSKLAQAQAAESPVLPSSKTPASRSDSFSSRITKDFESARLASHASKPEVRAKPAAVPEVDPHTLEREARNRERMLKEAQRMSLLMNRGDASAKGGRKGLGATKDKRGGSKVAEEDAEARARRVEQEREAQRWS